MIVIYILGGIFLVLIFAGVFAYLENRPLRPEGEGFEFVYVEEDGSVRELYPDEIEYLSFPFSPMDSGRPYIKTKYSSRTPDNKIWGYIRRVRVPKKMEIRLIDQSNRYGARYYSQ
jgi:hypothetical protein